MPRGIKLTDQQVESIRQLYDRRTVGGKRIWTYRAIATHFGIHRNTVYNRMRSIRLERKSEISSGNR